MITLIILLVILSGLFWIGFTITGVFLKALIWLLVLLPVSLLVMLLGLALCCTIILIPVGIKLIGAGFKILIPG